MVVPAGEEGKIVSQSLDREIEYFFTESYDERGDQAEQQRQKLQEDHDNSDLDCSKSESSEKALHSANSSQECFQCTCEQAIVSIAIA